MKIILVPIGYLRAPFNDDEIHLEVKDEIQVQTLLEELPLNRTVVLSAVVNDVTARMDTVLKDGDVVKLIPVISGG